jgi:hypothetical protein
MWGDEKALIEMAKKIVVRSTIGRRLFFYNGRCLAFFRVGVQE